MAPTPLLQRALEKAIDHPSFTARLPPLSEKKWMEILNGSDHAYRENDRLEFVGDALMYAALARQMYQQYPSSTAHFYTCIRGALNSNATFSRIAEKMEFYCVSNTVLKALTKRTFGEGALAPLKSKDQVKLTADLFETIVAAYYWEAGFEALFRWVRDTYHTLIRAAADEYYEYRRVHGHFRAHYLPYKPLLLTSPKKCAPSDTSTRCANQVTAIKHRLHTVEKIKARSSRSPSLKRAVLGSPNVVPKVVSAKIRSKASPEPAKPGSATQLVQAVPLAQKEVIFIDLTREPDSDDSGAEPEPSGGQSRALPPLPRREVFASNQPATSVPPPPSHLPPPLPSAAAPPGLTVTDTRPGCNGSLSTESEDEEILETMLTADGSDTDMDCSSSDVDSPRRPSGYAQLFGSSGSLPRWRSYNKDPFW